MGSKMLLLSVFVLITIGTGASKETDYRLPNSIVPDYYNIEIITHLENNSFSFEGSVWIKVRCLKTTQNIILHSLALIIDEKQVKILELPQNKSNTIDNFKYDEVNNFFIIKTVNDLTENQDYLIYIPFTGELEDGLDGFYRSSYASPKEGETRWLAVTQFEATSARKAFPCFDEPAMKAVFKISLGRMENYTTLSNMPLVTTEPMKDNPGWYWDHYTETVPMSTYLVAFAVTDFEYVSSVTKNGIVFRVWARSNAMQQVEFAKTLGPLCLEYYENFFNISYPLPKQDMIGLPDFDEGAMENWGLITFRESHLLYDAATASLSHKTFIAEIIAHELAHQWFGNLVTMKWWTDLWLNEGFATYMATLAVQNIFPEWKFYTHETINSLISVFSKDSLRTSHPVSVPVGNPNEIDEIFDEISYDKGSILLHMMANFLGATTFKQGVSSYLIKHKYHNAEQDDLWEALTYQAHLNNVLPKNLTVKTIMDTWTLQTGYPVITVTRDYELNSAKLTQERFLRDTIKANKLSKDCWWVPLTYTTKEALNFEMKRTENWLPCSNESSVIQGLPSSQEWVIFNIQATGLYRVNYDERNWNLLISTLNSDFHHKISPINKVLLIDDSANLAWVGSINYKTHFEILQYLKYECSYLPWQVALSNLHILNKILIRTSIYGLFKIYVKQLLTPIYTHIGGFKLPENIESSLEDIKHQVQITSWGCKFGVGECVKEAMKLFSEWQANSSSNKIPKDFRSIVYCNAIRHGGEKEWDFLWKHYQLSNSAKEKSSILQALSCTNEIWLLQRYLEWSINTNSEIRIQDCTTVLQAVVSNDVGYYVAKYFIYLKMADIYKHLSSSSRRLSRIIPSLASQMISEYDYKEFAQFAEENKQYLTENEQSINQALESIKLHIQWHSQHYDEIKKLLPNYIHK